MTRHATAGRPARRLRPGAALLVALLVLGVGVALGAVAVVKYRPVEVAAAQAATTMPVQPQDFPDQRSISLVARDCCTDR